MTYGGNRDEQPLSLRRVADGNFVAYGWTESDSFGGQSPIGFRDLAGVWLTPQGRVLRSARHGGLSDDHGWTVAPLASGDTVWTGYTWSSEWSGAGLGLEDAFAARLGADGNLSWVQGYGGSGSDFCLGATTLPGDHLALVGGTYGASFQELPTNGGSDLFVMRLAGDGRPQWTELYGGPGWEFARQVTLSPDGRLFVCGSIIDLDSNGSIVPNGEDGLVLVYDLNGTLREEHRYGSTGFERLDGVLFEPGGGWVVIGSTDSLTLDGQPGFGTVDAFVVRHDPAGERLWTRRFGGSGEDYLLGGAFLADGGLILGGSSESPVLLGHTNAGDKDAFLARMDSDGNFTWSALHGGESGDSAHDFLPDAFGGFWVVGETSSAEFLSQTTQGGDDFWLAYFCDLSLVSPTPTHTPTASPTSTGTHTPTHSPSVTPTASPTGTPTSTGTSTPTPSPSPSPSPSQRPSETPPPDKAYLLMRVGYEDPPRTLVVWLRAYSQRPQPFPAALYVAVEVGGVFYFLMEYGTEVLPVARVEIPARPFDTGEFELTRLRLPAEPLGLRCTWYGALIDERTGSVQGTLQVQQVEL